MTMTPATDEEVEAARRWAMERAASKKPSLLRLIARIDRAEAERDALRTVLARVATSSCCGSAHGQAIAVLDAWPEAQVAEKAPDE